jgi:transcriptional regulator with XRE-family HTH domain
MGNNRLRTVLKDRKMTALELHFRAGVSTNSIWAINKLGYKPTAPVIARLVSALNCAETDIWPEE